MIEIIGTDVAEFARNVTPVVLQIEGDYIGEYFARRARIAQVLKDEQAAQSAEPQSLAPVKPARQDRAIEIARMDQSLAAKDAELAAIKDELAARRKGIRPAAKSYATMRDGRVVTVPRCF